MLLGKRFHHVPGALAVVVAVLFICHLALSASTADEEPRDHHHHHHHHHHQSSTTSTNAEPAKHAYPAVPAIPVATKPTGASSSLSRPRKPPYRVNTIDGGDIALLLYSDASVIGQRLPIHLVTSLLPDRIDPDNVLLYSNQPETIDDWRIIDVFENTTTKTTAAGAAGAAAHHRRPKGPSQVALSQGSRHDENRFLPLLLHAGENKPHAKWYVFMQDDSYVFLMNVLHHLSTFDWEEPWYVAPETSQQGLFALSRTAWEQVFGLDDPQTLHARFAALRHITGLDQQRILERVLQEDGVQTGSPVLQQPRSRSHRASAIDRDNWCAPVYSWHGASARDISRLHGLELSWHSKRPLQYRDIYSNLIAHEMTHGRIDWLLSAATAAAGGQHAAEYEITAATAYDPANMPPDLDSVVAWQQGWQSADACETACALWPACVQWSFVGVGETDGDDDLQRCRVDRQVVFTFVGDGLQSTSGWMASRIDEWAC